MKRALDSGGGNQATLMPIVMGMARNGRVPVADLNRFIESLARSGVIPEQQVMSIQQSIQAVAQSRQTDSIVQQLNRPGQVNPNQFGGRPGPGFNGQPGFNNGRRGGPGGFNGGGGRRGPNGVFPPAQTPAPTVPPVVIR
jgi:hypothetical protein